MIDVQEAQRLTGLTAYTQDGDKLGKIGQVFLDDQTGRPEFVTVSTGLFGTKESFVPIGDATLADDRLAVPYTKDQVKDAPNVDLDGGHLDEAEEDRLYQHYGLSWSSTSGTGYGDGVGTGTTYTEGHDTSGPTTDQAMTRSEEHLDVGTTEREAGRARLRKYVTTDTETATVPVRKEHAVVEREPITDGNVGAALDGPEISEEEHEVVLHEEEAVVGKHAEPVERVRLGTETTVEEQTVSEEVRREQVEVEGDVDDRRL
jgi:uncharacterized protein (TIGR02271 family)